MATLSARTLALLTDGWRGSGGTAAYLALADRIRLLVLDGRIALGARLPAERDLAGLLGVSRTTVTAAYSALRDSGYLHSVRGSGSVAQLPLTAPPAAHAPATTGGSSAEASRGHVAPAAGPGANRKHHRGAGAVPPAASPYPDLSKASLPALPGVVAASRLAVEQLAGYLDSGSFDQVGLPVLRQKLAERYTMRGLPTEPGQIMVTLGAQHAIALISRTLLARGDRALVESPSYPHAFEALRDAGARLVPVSVDTDHGWDEQGFEQAIQRTSPSLGYLMPDFHNPTGQSMSAELRERVLGLADRHGTTLVADETMAELDIDRPGRMLPFAAYTTLTPPILIGSVGKTVWGGVRIGWIRAERPLIQRLVRARGAGDLGTPVLEQLVVANLVDDYDAILQLRREQLRAGRDLLSSLLVEKIPEWQVPRVDGGLTTWVNLGIPVSSQLTLAARTEGLNIAAGPRFGLEGAFERFLRIPFSHPPAEMDRAVTALAAAWQSVGRYPVAESPSLSGVV